MKLEKDCIREAAAHVRFKTQPFIGGRYVDAISGKTFASENPATGEVLTDIMQCDQQDVDMAVQAARKAFDSGAWPKMHAYERKEVLVRLAELIEKNADELAILDALDAGKPISDCVNIDIPEAVHCFRWHAEAADKLYGQVSPTGPGTVGMIIREPIGAVGAVVPWNFPLLMAAWKLGPALATGNTVVAKPSKQTTLSILRLAELAQEAGVPDGVLNAVSGPGETVGQALGRHMGIDAITFTGSTEVGRKLLQYSSESNLKRIVLELGGKSPQVVMGDVTDLDYVAEHVVNAAFWNMGENCSAGSRLVVHNSIKDALLEKVIARTREWPVGDPLEPTTKIGSMIDKRQMEKVLGYIETGEAEGAKVVLGGKRILHETGGYFIEPTIFENVQNNMKIAQEEIFGPVLVTTTFETEAEAIAIANDTPYGLAASLHTDDVSVAHRLARAIRAGTVSVNCYSEGDITTPFGGYKQSGFGGRDNGPHAHDQYTEIKTIWIQLK